MLSQNDLPQPQSWYSVKWQQLKNTSRTLSKSWQMRWLTSLLTGSSAGFATYELLSWATFPEALNVMTVIFTTTIVARRTSHTLSVAEAQQKHMENIVGQVNDKFIVINGSFRYFHNALSLRHQPIAIESPELSEIKLDTDAPITTRVEVEELLITPVTLPFPTETEAETEAPQSLSSNWHDCVRGVFRRTRFGFFGETPQQETPLNRHTPDAIGMASYQSDGETHLSGQYNSAPTSPR